MIEIVTIGFLIGAGIGVLFSVMAALPDGRSKVQPGIARTVCRVAAACGAVAAQLVLGFYQVGLPILVVPSGAIWVLWGTYALELVATLWLALRHPLLAPLVPLIATTALFATYQYGEARWGWGA